MSRTRRAVETAMEGEDEVAGLRRGLFTVADYNDDVKAHLDKLNMRVVSIGSGIIVALVAAAIGTWF